MQTSPPVVIRQLPLEKMERGLAHPVATLRWSSEEIHRRTGVQFTSTQDDLDELDAALLTTATGRQFALVRHRHQPREGTDVLINERSTNPDGDLQSALEELQCTAEDILWLHPDLREICKADKASLPVSPESDGQPA